MAITKHSIKFSNSDGLTADADTISRLATQGFYSGPAHQEYLRNTSRGACNYLRDKGFHAFIDDNDLADRAITVTAQDGWTAQLKWVETDHGNEEGYEVVEVRYDGH